MQDTQINFQETHSQNFKIEDRREQQTNEAKNQLVLQPEEDQTYENKNDLIEECKFEITESSQLENIINKYRTVLVKFYAEHCPICANLGPILQKRCNDDRNWALASIDAKNSNNQKIVTIHKVDRVPTVLMFRDDQPAFEMLHDSATWPDFYKLANADDIENEKDNFYVKNQKELAQQRALDQLQLKQEQEKQKQKFQDFQINDSDSDDSSNTSDDSSCTSSIEDELNEKTSVNQQNGKQAWGL